MEFHKFNKDTCLTADPWVANSILAQSHNFVEIDHEIISMVILLLSPDSRRLLSITCENMCKKNW